MEGLKWAIREDEDPDAEWEVVLTCESYAWAVRLEAAIRAHVTVGAVVTLRQKPRDG
jgi:hypothetical protein